MAIQDPNVPSSWQSSATQSEAGKGAGQAIKAGEQIASSALERVHEVRDKAESGLSQQRGQLTVRIRRVGDALARTSDQLRQDDTFVANYLDQARSGVERFASYVSTVKVSEVVQDVERFARQRPALFFGGMFLFGLAVGRFVKSSAPREESLETAIHRFEDEGGPSMPPQRKPAQSATAQGGVSAKPAVPVGGPAPRSNAPAATPQVRTGDRPQHSTATGMGPVGPRVP